MAHSAGRRMLFLAEPFLDFGGNYIIETGFPVFGLTCIFPPLMACQVKRIDAEVEVQVLVTAVGGMDAIDDLALVCIIEIICQFPGKVIKVNIAFGKQFFTFFGNGEVFVVYKTVLLVIAPIQLLGKLKLADYRVHACILQDANPAPSN